MIIFEFIKSLFKKSKKQKIELIEENIKLETENASNDDIFNKRKNFIKTIDQKFENELISLQNEVENKEIDVKNLNIFEVVDLIDKYEKDIQQIDNKIKQN